MKRSATLIVALIVLAIVAYAWHLHEYQTEPNRENTPAAADTSSGIVASVQVKPIRSGTIADEITAYGSIVPAAGAMRSVTVPFESRVHRILVSEGQQVAAGDSLLELEPSADSKLQYQQARSEVDAAEKTLEFVQQRFELKLATNDQALAAKQALEQAQAKLESLRARGSDGPQTLRAESDSVVAKADVQAGAIVPAGGALIELVGHSRFSARLGIEPNDRNKIKPGQEVALAPVNAPPGKPVRGKIRRLSPAANAATHLIDGLVDVPAHSGFFLNEFVVGRIAVARSQGLLVPRSAVLPEGSRTVVFTVKNGRAQEHEVQVHGEAGGEAQVDGKDLQAGDRVVSLGNYELKDGMAVSIQPAQ